MRTFETWLIETHGPKVHRITKLLTNPTDEAGDKNNKNNRRKELSDVVKTYRKSKIGGKALTRFI